MLRFVPRRLAIGSYSLFMMEQKNNPKLKGLAIADRGKMTSKLYKALSPNEMAQLKKRASEYQTTRQKSGLSKPKKAPAAPRQPSAYAMFVKDNIHRFDKLPQRERMAAVGKLWKQQQQQRGGK